MLIIAGNSLFAQTNNWKYDFGESETSFNPNPGASSTRFLPKPAVNAKKSLRQIARVRTSSDGTGEFHLVKDGASFIKGAGLEIIAGTTSSKFSLYNIDAGAVSKTEFDIRFDNSSAGQWIFANGNARDTDDIFQGNAAIKETNTEIFAGLRWVLTEANELKFYTRDKEKWKMVKAHPFTKNGEYRIEIISNNGTSSKTYKQEDGETINAGTFHIWVNGKKIANEFSNGGLEPEGNLSALILYGVTPKGTDKMAKAWVDNLTFTDAL